MRAVCVVFTVLVALFCLLRGHTEGMINGTDAMIEKYPWFVSYPTLEPRTNYPICGGSLIHPQVVLTATHCIGNRPASSFVGMPVVIGPRSHILLDSEMSRISRLHAAQRLEELKKPSTAARLAKYGQVRRIARVVDIGDDLALFLLDAPSTQSPVLLATRAPKDGEAVKAIGYGRTNTFAQPTEPVYKKSLQAVTMHAFLARSREPGKAPTAADRCPPAYVCTTSKTQTPCNGDSGSALLSSSGRLVGVVKAGNPGCAPYEKQIMASFMSVAHFRDTIQQAVAAMTKK